ncbi:MAG TPA: hypothetical protein VFB79_07690, partial [Candidatus Angelobacter sp.]|nr:hypothetical protein [Candidatus Angelobacter sp.]
QNPGVDPAQYVAAAQQKAVDQYNADYAANFQRLGGFSLIPFSPVVGGDKAALDALTPKLPDVCSWIPLLCTDGSDFSGIEEILLIGLLIIGLVLVITVVKAV